jgi:hypothetical protein
MTLVLQAQYKPATYEYKPCIFFNEPLGECQIYSLNHCAARLAK